MIKVLGRYPRSDRSKRKNEGLPHFKQTKRARNFRVNGEILPSMNMKFYFSCIFLFLDSVGVTHLLSLRRQTAANQSCRDRANAGKAAALRGMPALSEVPAYECHLIWRAREGCMSLEQNTCECCLHLSEFGTRGSLKSEMSGSFLV